MALKQRIGKVTSEHIKVVINDILTAKLQVPRNRKAKKWCIQRDGAYYASKYVLGKAIEIATPSEKPILSSDFSGGNFTVNSLKRILKNDLSTKIVRCPHGMALQK